MRPRAQLNIRPLSTLKIQYCKMPQCLPNETLRLSVWWWSRAKCWLTQSGQGWGAVRRPGEAKRVVFKDTPAKGCWHRPVTFDMIASLYAVESVLGDEILLWVKVTLESGRFAWEVWQFAFGSGQVAGYRPHVSGVKVCSVARAVSRRSISTGLSRFVSASADSHFMIKIMKKSH